MAPQVFATTRDLEVLGLAADRARSMPLADRRLALMAGSQVIAPYLRARFALPLAVELSRRELDLSGLVGGASVSPVGTPSEVQSVGVRFPVAGIVGASGLTYQITTDAGAYGAVYGPALALPTSGEITIDGITWTVAGELVTDDVFTYVTRADAGAAWASVQVAMWILLGSTGVDPASQTDDKYRYEAAIKWGEALRSGPAQLDQKMDATRSRAELGPRGSGQKTPWAFLERRR